MAKWADIAGNPWPWVQFRSYIEKLDKSVLSQCVQQVSTWLKHAPSHQVIVFSSKDTMKGDTKHTSSILVKKECAKNRSL